MGETAATIDEWRRGATRLADEVAAELGLDRERVRGRATAQTVAWSESTRPAHLETAEWLLEDAP